MKDIRRILSLILCLMLLTVLLPACGGNESSKKTTTGQDSSTSEDAPWQSATEGSGGIALPISKELLEYTYMVYEVAAYSYKDTFIAIPELEKRTNVRLNLNVCPVEGFADKTNVQLSSNTFDDMIGGMDIMKVNKHGREGKFLNFMEYLDDMPNLKKVLEKYPELLLKNYDANTMYGIPVSMSERNDPRSIIRNTWLVRYDIVEKHNFKIPETYDELYLFLKQLRELYKDSIPVTDRHGLTIFLALLSEQWGMNISQEHYIFDFEKELYTFAPEDPRYKELFEFVVKLYQEGLLDEEIILPSTTQWQERMISGKSFMTYDWVTRAEVFTQAAISNGDTDFRMGAIMPPKAPYGERLVKSNEISRSTIVVNKDVKNPRELVRLLDYWLYSEEGSILNFLGVEGKTFQWVDAEKTKWEYLPDGEFTNPTDMDYKVKYGLSVDVISGVKPEFYGIYKATIPNDQLQKDSEMLINHLMPCEPPVFWNEEEEEQMAKLTLLSDYYRQYLTSVLIKEDDIGNWDKFIQRCKELGSEIAVKTYNDNWARRTKTNK